MDVQQSLFESSAASFPTTRYQGSKAKLLPWLCQHLLPLRARSFLDVFGGTGVVSHRMKQEGLRVTYNDALRFNHLIGKALVENSRVRVSSEDLEWILADHHSSYPTVVSDNFKEVYFTDDENCWIDRTITNINELKNEYKQAVAFFALAQACIVKRPYNLFHRKNLYVRLANVERSFGNKTSWDRPFESWYRQFIAEANAALVDNSKKNLSLQLDAGECPTDHELVYMDPPYVPQSGQPVDYRGFYHFLEGLASYSRWVGEIDFDSKHRRLQPIPSPWVNRHDNKGAIEALFDRYRASTIAFSYRSDGIPSDQELVGLLKKFKKNVTVHRFDSYQYVLSTNKRSGELLIIGRS